MNIYREKASVVIKAARIPSRIIVATPSKNRKRYHIKMPMTQAQDGSPIVPIWIDGKATPVDSSHLLSVYSAAQKTNVYTAQSATPELARRAADSAWTAFLSWKNTSYTHRRDLLLRTAD